MSKKHAYLIMAHNEFELLKRLILMLDDEEADIYLHIDKKVKNVPIEDIISVAEKSNIYMMPRQKIMWGSESQIKCTIELLKKSTVKEYMYYHLLSGLDFPIKSKYEITRHFDECLNSEFIWLDKRESKVKSALDRIRYYYFFQNQIGRDNNPRAHIYELLERVSLNVQKTLKIDRTKNITIPLYKGSNWFSITHNMAVYFVSNKKNIHKWFRWTLCGDELCIPSVAMSSPYKNKIAYNDLRENDWNRGKPYVYTQEDFELLINSNNLFARKVSFEKSPELILMLEKQLKNNDGK